ncbi:MAG: SHOCT domain-containing protein [Caulobacter sp.]|nr:SHOCT domain-containing protein [Vitreoscilla sp.]
MAPAAVAPVAVAPVAPVAPVVTPTANDAEQRLLTLKRLYDKGLITKPEYDKKRAEILKSL